jgi:hypothetical protein
MTLTSTGTKRKPVDAVKAAAEGPLSAEELRKLHAYWRAEEGSPPGGSTCRYRPHGERIGWLVEGEVYLEPDISFATAQRLARDQGETLPVGAATLRRRLRDTGLLATTDTARGKLTVRKTLQGERRDVQHVAALGGLDALVFTVGIGEHAASIRARVCKDAAWLRVTLDEGGQLRRRPPDLADQAGALGLSHPHR